jgi:guanylate kinase
LVVSSPSGAGKTTLCRKLTSEFPALAFSVSYTTRPPRAGEREGVDYHFVDVDRFEAMVRDGELAEWAYVHGNRYGTSVAAVRQAIDGGRDVLFDIDHQGSRQIRARFGRDVVAAFILPPSIAELERRLLTRATDAKEVIERRMLKAREEIDHYQIYDYLIVNDDLERAYLELKSVYVAAHVAWERNAHHAERLITESQSRPARPT